MPFSRFSVFILILGRPSWIFVEVSADYSFSRSVLDGADAQFSCQFYAVMCRALVKHVYLTTIHKIKRKIKKIKKTGQTRLKPE